MKPEITNLDNLKSANDSRWLATWEIVSVLISCLIAEWVVLAFVGNNKLVLAVPVLLALGLMIFSHLERGESLREIGFRIDNLAPALRILLLPTSAVIIGALSVVFVTSTLTDIAPWRNRFFALPLWALFQQYALNGFINRRAQLALGPGRRSVVLVALVFSILHLPNPMLAIVTFVGGLIWAAAYQKEPNLFALAISHTVVSITLALTLSSSLESLRVGFKYFGFIWF
jgi:hypothetical protein